jgi:hypothetical protein
MCIRGWRGVSTAGRRSSSWSGGGGPVAVAEFQAAAVPEDFIVNAWQVIMV